MREIHRVFRRDIIKHRGEAFVLVDTGQRAVARPIGRTPLAVQRPLTRMADPELRRGCECELQRIFLIARLSGPEIRRACHQIARRFIGIKIYVLLITMRGAAHKLKTRLYIEIGRIVPRRLVIRQAKGNHALARVARSAAAIADPAHERCAVGPVSELLLEVRASGGPCEKAFAAVYGQQIKHIVHAPFCQYPQLSVLRPGIEAGQAQQVDGQVSAGVPFRKALV